MNVEHHILATLAGPIISTMYTGGDRDARYHQWAVALHEAAHAAVAAPRSDTSQALCMLWLSQGCEDWRETRHRGQ